MQRLHFWYDTFNYSPLGCVTGFSTTFPIDRYLTAELLGCYGPEPNSIDPVTSRWEPEAELAQILAVLLAHLASMAQTFILFSTQEFGVLKLHPRENARCLRASPSPRIRTLLAIGVLADEIGGSRWGRCFPVADFPRERLGCPAE